MGSRSLGGCRGPEMGAEGLKLVWRALGGCGGTEMGLKDFGWYGCP